MTPTGALLTLGGLFVLYEGFRFMSVKQMNLSLATVDASQQGLTTNVQLGIKVDNPTQWQNTIDGIEGDIYANGNYLGHASVLGPVEIPAFRTSNIPLGLSISDLSLASILLAIIAGTAKNAVVNVKGKVRADGLPFSIPIDLTYQII